MRLALAGIVGLLTCACNSTRQAAENELVLRGDVIARQIQASLSGTTGEFHCDQIGSDGGRKPGCYLQLGPQLGARRFEFSLPDRVVDLGFGGQLVYKVNRIKLQSVEVRSAVGEFVIAARFLSPDVALKGSHSVLGDAAVPDIKLENMRLTIRLTPQVGAGNKISYERPTVEFKANVDNTFIPRFKVMGKTIDVMDSLTNYRRDLCASIQKQIQLALEDPARKAALAKKIEEGIAGQITGPSSPVIGLRFHGTDLIVKLRR